MAVYFIQHTKADSIKFVGHLDLQTTIHRNINRARLDVAFSKGFNPHMLMSSAQPLSVGVSSDAEYIMLELTTEKSEQEILDDLNRTAPPGIRYIQVYEVGEKTHPPMSLLDAVDSEIRIPSTREFSEAVRNIFESGEPMPVLTKNKKGVETARDLRPFILPGAEISWENGFTLLKLTTYAGSRRHVNLDHLLKFLRENAEGMDETRFTHIRRLEMYTERNGQLVALGDIR